MNKQEAMAMLKFISELYMIVSTPDPESVHQVSEESEFAKPVIVK